MSPTTNKFAAVDIDRLVMVLVKVGQESTISTGYLIRSWLLLTTSHIPLGFDCHISARQESTGEWLLVKPEPLWLSRDLDAAMFELLRPVSNVPNWVPEFAEGKLVKDGSWVSVGYPDASRKNKPEVLVRSSGLSGHFYVFGGRGQGLADLELTVDAPPYDTAGWKGISGAPVFIDYMLVGLIKESLPSFSQQRLLATPISAILQDRTAWGTISRGYPTSIIASCLVGRKPHEKPCEISLPPNDGQSLFQDDSEAPQMVVVPAGEFVMGRSDHSAIDDGEGPRRHVIVEDAFAISRYPITLREFRSFIEDSKLKIPEFAWTYEHDVWDFRIERDFRNPGFVQTEHHPAVCISWTFAKQYCSWLRSKTGQNYRLPTEAEWEYVARTGTQLSNSELLRTAKQGSGHHFTQAVNEGTPNAWGISDLFGNVWQWVEDCWHDNYIGASHNAYSWHNESNGDCSRRVVRGGSWATKNQQYYLTVRKPIGDSIALSDVGFRVVRDVVINPPASNND